MDIKTPADPDSDASKRRIIGGFISAAGVGVMALAMIEIWEQWFPDADAVHPLLVVPLIAAAVITLFWALNPVAPEHLARRSLDEEAIADELEALAARTDSADEYREIESRRRWLEQRRQVLEKERQTRAREWPRVRFRRSQRAMLVGVAILALTAVLFGKVALEARQKAVFDHYAVSLALPADQQPPKASANAAASAGFTRLAAESSANASSGTLGNEAQTPTLVAWSVERKRSRLPAGVPAIFLGGLFVCAFGIWFPKIGVLESKDGLEVGEKLLAPILSLALIVLGVSQQADAAKDDKNIQLAQQGLPAVAGLSKSDVARNTFEQSQIYVLERDGLNNDTVAFLEQNLTKLLDQLNHNADDARNANAATNGAVKGVSAKIESLMLALESHHPGPSPVGPDDLAEMRKAVVSLNLLAQKDSETATAAWSQAHTQACALENVKQTDLEDEAKSWSAAAKQKDADLQAYRKHWYHWFLKGPPDGSQDKLKAAEAEAASNLVDHQMKVICGANIPNNREPSKTP